MDSVRIGIIGIGNMGSHHAKYIADGDIRGAKLTAVCDVNPDRLKWAKENLDENVKVFDSTDELFGSKCRWCHNCNTHYSHPSFAIKAFKTISCPHRKTGRCIYKTGQEMNEIAKSTDKVFGIMYNQRTNPIYQELGT